MKEALHLPASPESPISIAGQFAYICTVFMAVRIMYVYRVDMEFSYGFTSFTGHGSTNIDLVF